MSILPTVSLSVVIACLRQHLDHHLLPSKRQLDDYGLESNSFPDWFGTHLPPSLAVLDLHSTAVSEVIPFSLGRTASLSMLSLTGDIPATLGGLQHPTHLNLSRNTLSGSVPPALAALSNLSLLDRSVFSCANSLFEFTIAGSAAARLRRRLSPTRTPPPVSVATFLVAGRHRIASPIPLSPHETKESP